MFQRGRWVVAMVLPDLLLHGPLGSFSPFRVAAWISDRTTVITRSEPDIRIFTKSSFKLYLQLASAILGFHHIRFEKVRTALDEPHAAWELTWIAALSSAWPPTFLILFIPGLLLIFPVMSPNVLLRVNYHTAGLKVIPLSFPHLPAECHLELKIKQPKVYPSGGYP